MSDQHHHFAARHATKSHSRLGVAHCPCPLNHPELIAEFVSCCQVMSGANVRHGFCVDRLPQAHWMDDEVHYAGRCPPLPFHRVRRCSLATVARSKLSSGGVERAASTARRVFRFHSDLWAFSRGTRSLEWPNSAMAWLVTSVRLNAWIYTCLPCVVSESARALRIILPYNCVRNFDLLPMVVSSRGC